LNVLTDWTLAAKNLFLPIFCKQCGDKLLTEESGFFCPTCWELSPRVSRPFCSQCGRPHQGVIGFGSLSNFPCADCRERKSHPIRRTYGAAIYEGAVESAIKLLKFGDKQRLAAPLAEMMAEFAAREMDCEVYDFVVPVPLHKVRQRERGFNQSRLLAEKLLPAFPNAQLDESLKRVRPTRMQSRASTPAERRANVRGAFGVVGGTLTGKTVLLIDDVVTTGETTIECAMALKRAKAAAVDVLAAALVVSSQSRLT
jgi:ComF family protein